MLPPTFGPQYAAFVVPMFLMNSSPPLVGTPNVLSLVVSDSVPPVRLAVLCVICTLPGFHVARNDPFVKLLLVVIVISFAMIAAPYIPSMPSISVKSNAPYTWKSL